jgi:hypothetical protein
MRAVFLVNNKKEILEIIAKLNAISDDFKGGLIEFNRDKTTIISRPRENNGHQLDEGKEKTKLVKSPHSTKATVKPPRPKSKKEYHMEPVNLGKLWENQEHHSQ